MPIGDLDREGRGIDGGLLREAIDKLSQAPIYIDDQPGSNILRFDLDEILAWTKAITNK